MRYSWEMDEPEQLVPESEAMFPPELPSIPSWLTSGLKESYGKYQEMAERFRKDIEGLPFGKQITKVSDVLSKASEVPGVEFAIPPFASILPKGMSGIIKGKPTSQNLYQKATTQGINVYRGERTIPISGKYASDPGDFGRGIYYTVRKARAESYGGKGKIKKDIVKFKNPLILSEDDAYKLSDQYGTITGELPIGTGVGSEKFRLQNAQKMTEDLLSQGYDGLISIRRSGDLEIVDYRPYQKKKLLPSGIEKSVKLTKAIDVYRAADKPFNPKLIQRGVHVTENPQIANYFKTEGRFIEKLQLKKGAKLLEYEDIPDDIKKISNWDDYNEAVVKYAENNAYDAVRSTPKHLLPSGVEQSTEITIVNPNILKSLEKQGRIER